MLLKFWMEWQIANKKKYNTYSHNLVAMKLLLKLNMAADMTTNDHMAEEFRTDMLKRQEEEINVNNLQKKI